MRKLKALWLVGAVAGVLILGTVTTASAGAKAKSSQVTTHASVIGPQAMGGDPDVPSGGPVSWFMALLRSLGM